MDRSRTSAPHFVLIDDTSDLHMYTYVIGTYILYYMVYVIYIYTYMYSEAAGHVRLLAVLPARLAEIRRVWAGIPGGPYSGGALAEPLPEHHVRPADTRSDREDTRTRPCAGDQCVLAMRGDRDHITIMNQFTDEYHFYHAADYHHPSEYEPAATAYDYHHHPVKNEAEYYLGQSAAAVAVDPYCYDAAGYCTGGYSPYDTVATCNGGSWSSSQDYSSGADGQPYGCGWTPAATDHGPPLLQAALPPIPQPSPALPAGQVSEPLPDFGDDLHRGLSPVNGFQHDGGSDQTTTVNDQLLFSK